MDRFTAVLPHTEPFFQSLSLSFSQPVSGEGGRTAQHESLLAGSRRRHGPVASQARANAHGARSVASGRSRSERRRRPLSRSDGRSGRERGGG
jgi:hypothetical protein